MIEICIIILLFITGLYNIIYHFTRVNQILYSHGYIEWSSLLLGLSGIIMILSIFFLFYKKPIKEEISYLYFILGYYMFSWAILLCIFVIFQSDIMKQPATILARISFPLPYFISAILLFYLGYRIYKYQQIQFKKD